MMGPWARAFGRAATDSAVRCVLTTGRGGAFTAGNDLNDFLNSPDASIAPDNMDRPALRFLRAIATAAKPRVAAVHAAAARRGNTMLLHCDPVPAGRGARLQLPLTNLAPPPAAA